MAVVPIVTGASSSLKMPKDAKRKLIQHERQQRRSARNKQRQRHKSKDDDGQDLSDDDSTSDSSSDSDKDDQTELVSITDAYAFPILGSIVLLALYLAFKYLDPTWVNWLVGKYLALMGIGSLTRASIKLIKALNIVNEVQYKRMTTYGIVWTLKRRSSIQQRHRHRHSTLDNDKLNHNDDNKPRSNQNQTELVSFNLIQLSSFIIAIMLTLYQHWKPNWIIANWMALTFAFNAIGLMKLDSFMTGSVLLGLLFFYDIWYVHWFVRARIQIEIGFDVMVSVATKLDAPIKITFPKDLIQFKGFSLLGLGDIVLPGIFVALAMRFDYHQALSRSIEQKQIPIKPLINKFKKPYFWTVLIAYILGLTMTIVVMHTFKAAQPALLYLSPACITSVFICALFRGELKNLLEFSEPEEEEEQEKEEKQNQQKKRNQKQQKGKKQKTRDSTKDGNTCKKFKK
ncbi:hypothetical protein OIO90_002291 [Microbotryomycetes sp. JL221]|nr:hypothetical protein OIO90_002291 [Microbotryomycetes sp. JL221]